MYDGEIVKDHGQKKTTAGLLKKFTRSYHFVRFLYTSYKGEDMHSNSREKCVVGRINYDIGFLRLAVVVILYNKKMELKLLVSK